MDFGLIVDVETTGLDPVADQIIEIGVIEFAVQGSSLPQITRMYGALQDPGVPLSPEIERITGITTAALAGQAIDWAVVRNIFARASIVIAHNAKFDRAFIEASGQLGSQSLHWACSLSHVDWRAKGFTSKALSHLAADHGFVNAFAHRAVFDCATTFRLVAPHLEELIARSYEREFVLRAVGAPFETKDQLRQRGYAWDSEQRVWWKLVGESALAAERAFLATDVYRGASRHVEVAQGEVS